MVKLLLRIFTVLALCMGLGCYAQLPDFNLSVTPTGQTCLGNGALSFTVSGNTPQATIEYAVYMLPNTTTPVVTVTTATALNLVSGSYMVIATQSLNGQSNTATADAIIEDYTQPLTYTLLLTPLNCQSQGTITVNVTSGAAESYEILSGPVTVPAQSSNVFSNLPEGQYQVRVFDICGNAVVVTAQLVQQQMIDLEINYPTETLLTCTTMSTSLPYFVEGPGNLAYPLTCKFTVHPPGNASLVIITQTIASGANFGNAVATLPFYGGPQYTYDLEIKDACNHTYYRPANYVNKVFNATVNQQSQSCGNYYLSCYVNNAVLPVTVSFLNAPDGFNPLSYNASHPLFNTLSFSYGSNTNPLPTGTYTIKFTDSCGHTVTRNIDITNAPPFELFSINQSTCLGMVRISTANLSVITAAVLTEAPESYEGTLPENVIEYVNGSSLQMENLPIGEYTFTITDACGQVFEVEIEIEAPIPNLNMHYGVMMGCEEGTGSFDVFASGKFTEIIITEAPESFGGTLPFDASSLLDEVGQLHMNNVPEGLYTFTTLDACGNVREGSLWAEGFELISNTTTILPNCGSFDVDLQYSSNSVSSGTFWLQQYDEASGQWKHPETGMLYDPMSYPTESTAIPLQNYQINYSLQYSGQLRIIWAYYAYGDPDQDVLTFCTKEVLAFNYLAQPAITSAYSFPCQNGTYDVFVEGQGVAPLTYEITEKNNESFVVDNGTSNLFMGLEDAVYKFRVTDSCNNLSTVLLNLSSLTPLEITGDAFCEGEQVELSLPQYTFLTYEWWKEDAPGVILSTNSSLVFPAFDGETQSGIYKVHIVATVQGSCIDLVLDKTVTPALAPNAGTSAELVLCNDGQDIDLNAYLGDSFDEGGTWTDEDQTQVLTGNIVSTATLVQGTYHFKYTVNNACGLTDTSVITLHLKDQPSAPTAGFSGILCEGEVIELYANGTEVEGATYSWSGPNNFTSTLRTPVLENVLPTMNGTYIVTQTLPGVECASAPAMVTLTINEGPHFTLESDLQLCSGGESVLRVVPSNFAPGQGDYQWFLGGSPLEGTDTLTITEEGSYSVTVALGLCTTSQSLNVTFETNAFDVHLTTGCEAGKYVITIDEEAELAGALFMWSGPESYTSAEDHAEITGAAAGDYSVTVTKANGCTATATIPVSVTQCGNSNIPNGVSPNGDGKNDSFNLAGFGVDEIVIFNRYGLEVYRAANYTNEWYGQSDKGELPTATYFYTLSLAGGKQVTGWVYLQREIN